ncbi:MAG: hypothetical protein WBW48_07145 [Anaerolineae bacterium]
MLRAAGLHLLRGGIQRFSTIGHPIALAACYVPAGGYHDRTPTG